MVVGDEGSPLLEPHRPPARPNMQTPASSVTVSTAARAAPRLRRSSAPLQRPGRRAPGGVVTQAKSKGDGKSDVLVFEPMKEVTGTLQLVERAGGAVSLARQSYEKSLEDAINDQVRLAHVSLMWRYLYIRRQLGIAKK